MKFQSSKNGSNLFANPVTNVIACSTATVLLNKLQFFRDILEENSFQLTDMQVSPVIFGTIYTKWRENLEIDGKAFDDPTRLGEFLAIVVHFVTIILLHTTLWKLAKNFTCKEIVNACSFQQSMVLGPKIFHNCDER